MILRNSVENSVCSLDIIHDMLGLLDYTHTYLAKWTLTLVLGIFPLLPRFSRTASPSRESIVYFTPQVHNILFSSLLVPTTGRILYICIYIDILMLSQLK